ncbi:MAG TPA: DUF6152 family protein [Gammaproteobacteria bacterium]
MSTIHLPKGLPILLAATFALTISGRAPAHHSVAAFYDRSQKAEVEGVVTDLFWRNPHIGITILVENEQGEDEEWELEGGTYNDLVRSGFDTDRLRVGDRIRAVGGTARRGAKAIYLDSFFLPSGEEVVIAGSGSATSTAAAAATEIPEESGLFRVWSNPGMGIYQLRAPLALTAEAQAMLDAWDPVNDDPGLRCEAPGMPNAILNPYPIAFIDNGDTITIQIEEWDARRIVHLDPDAEPAGPPRLGHSIGRWEGNTLVVETTNTDWLYLDDKGAPMSEDAVIVERFVLSDNDTRLDHEIRVTDPRFLAEPAIWDQPWTSKPGVQIQPFECTVR